MIENRTLNNNWVLDSHIAVFIKDYMSTNYSSELIKNSFNGNLEQLILNSAEPYLDEYHKLSLSHDSSSSKKNTKHLMAKEWLYENIQTHLDHLFQ